jgi:Ca2+-binding RTX toxin-like protein
MALFDGTPGNDTLNGTTLDDVINGLAGRDQLWGGLGNDKLDGGTENDYLNGGDGNDTLIGGDGNDILVGDIGNDAMSGGLGDDIYAVDSATDRVTELAGQGRDVVLSSLIAYTLAANVEGLALGSTGVNGTGNTLDNTISGNGFANKLDGGLGNDELYGEAGADTLIGSAGNDTLDGGRHADSMAGGAGNDVYIVDDAGDVTTELAGAGTDLVKTTVDGFMLGANIENLTLTGSADISGNGNDLANLLLGNAGNNMLTAFKGNDTLDGGKGDDTLRGGLGNDTYLVDSRFDVVLESAGEGKDTIQSSVSYRLAEGQEIETLILSPTSLNVTGDGNSMANAIIQAGAGKSTLSGHGGDDTLTGGVLNDTLFGDNDNDTLNGEGAGDVLFGGYGNDKLNGGEGYDFLVGGAGNDTMAGGAGQDRYYVEDRGDVVIELAGGAWDSVVSYLPDYVMHANVEFLELGGGALNGTGNTLNNALTGNAAGNVLNGNVGNDILRGDDGNDTLHGGAGFDVLEGGLGADTLFSESGRDGFQYYVESVADLPALGGDVINGFQTGVDVIELTRLLELFAIDPDAALSGGFVRLTASGSDTLVQFDRDGSVGGASSLTLATVSGAVVAPADLALDHYILS